MKFKHLAAMLAIGLCATSISFAEGMDSTDDSAAGFQNLAMDNTTSNANAVMQNPGSDPSANPNVASAGTSSSSMDSGNSTASPSGEDMSADTATGDDDY